MTIIEVLKKAKPGQRIKRHGWSDSLIIPKAVHSILLFEAIGSEYIPHQEDLAADDWEIWTAVKTSRRWEGELKLGRYVYNRSLMRELAICYLSEPGHGWFDAYDKIPSDTICKVTVEWEE